MLTKQDLINDLIKMGIEETNTVFIHSSYKHIAGLEGVKGGAETVAQAFIDYISPKGLMVFPAMSWKLGWLVNDAGDYIPPYEGPREGFYPYGTAYNVRTTPTSDIGIIPEVARQLPGAVRSLCPTSSVCAFGADAKEFCAGHEYAPSPLSFKSPWGKLYERKAKIIFLGTTMCCNTFLHAVEDYADLPGLFTPYLWEYTVEDYDGNVFPVSFHRHEPGHNHYYIKIQQDLIDRGIARVVKFGHAECQLVDAAAEADYVLERLKENPALFTHEYNKKYPVWPKSNGDLIL